MRSSNEKPSKRALSRGENDIDEYFAELKSAQVETDDAPEPIQGKADLSDSEEIRRLMAYVAHLRERVVEIQTPTMSTSVKQLPNSLNALIGLTGTIGAVVVFGIIARRLSRYR